MGAERIRLLTKTAPFQLPLFLQTTPGERIPVSCPGRTGVEVPHDEGAGLGHNQHRKFLAGCAFVMILISCCGKSVINIYCSCHH